MRPRSAARCLPISFVSILALSSHAKAETLTYGVDAGVAESDNVTLVSSDKTSQTMAVADADFDVKQQSRLLDVDAKGNFTYLDYLQGAYSSQLIGRFDGSAHLAIIPDRIVWVVQDDFGQQALDPYTPLTPANLENVNYLSTGPDFALRFGASSYLNASARYARAEYATSPFNSNRILGNLAWGYQLSAQSTVSLNGDSERVLFENTALNSDFDRSSGFVRYEAHGARTDLSADAGATTINQDGTSTSGGLAKLQLSRKLSAAAKLTASVGRDLTDASTSFSNLQSGATGVVGTAPAALTSNNYTSDYASIGWEYVRNRTTLALSARWEKDDYQSEPSLDVRRSGLEFRVARRLTQALTAEVLGRVYKTDYVNGIVAAQSGTANYNNELFAADLTWRHGRGLEVKLRCEHSAEVTTGIYGYRENRATLTIGYRPGGRQTQNDPGA